MQRVNLSCEPPALTLTCYADAAILSFSDLLAPAKDTRSTWANVFRKNFNSKTKYMLQLSRFSGVSLDSNSVVPPLAPWDHFRPGSFLLTVKGAPEILLNHCSHVLDPLGGSPITLGARELQRIIQVQEQWSSQGQRVILLARRIVNDEYLEQFADRQSEDFGDIVDKYLRDLTIVGLVGLIDPLKSDVKHTVR